ncbi:MAG: M23 family metallopeptidase [Rhodospirillaceae bacterium]|nr:M23 family metallopeptidase [Rhodospirillaceae bacterium]
MRAQITALALLAAASARAEIVLDGKIEQGGLALGRVAPGATVEFAGRTVPVTPDGRFVIGFDRDAPVQADLAIVRPDGGRDAQTLRIAARTWQIERVEGLPQKLVTPDPATAAKIAADNALLAATRERTEAIPFFDTGFVMPAKGRISGVFGSQRVLNGVPRAPHVGLDIAGPVGTPVIAAADGIVALAKADMVLTGQTVVIEHGYGLDSVYIHMSDISVSDGERVRQGQRIGAIGQSGRANGPHLHFGVTWFDVRLDPETVLAVLPASAAGQNAAQ